MVAKQPPSARGGLNKDRLTKGKSAPSPPAPAKKGPAQPVSGRRAGGGGSSHSSTSPSSNSNNTKSSTAATHKTPTVTSGGNGGTHNNGREVVPPLPTGGKKTAAPVGGTAGPTSGRRAGQQPATTTHHANTGSHLSNNKQQDSNGSKSPSPLTGSNSPVKSGLNVSHEHRGDKGRVVGFGAGVDLDRGLEKSGHNNHNNLGDSHNSLDRSGSAASGHPAFLEDSHSQGSSHHSSPFGGGGGSGGFGGFSAFGGGESDSGGGNSLSADSIDAKLENVIAGLRRTWGMIRRQSQMGSPSDAELKKMEQQQKDLEQAKRKAAQEIDSWGTGLALENPEDNEEDFIDFIDRLVMETDGKPGNLELVKVCIENFTPAVDFPKIISDRQWIVNSAADGSLGFMELFFNVPNISDSLENDLQEIVATTCYNQTCRIPMMSLLLKYDSTVLKMDRASEELHPLFDEFFSDVASEKKSIPREDRNGKMEVLSKLITNPFIQVSADGEEAGDGMNVFHRAASEGDEDMLQLILVKHKNMVRNVNQVLGEGFTALIRAAMGDHLKTVELLLKQPNIDTTQRCPEGTALEVARKLQRNPLLIAALEGAGK